MNKRILRLEDFQKLYQEHNSIYIGQKYESYLILIENRIDPANGFFDLETIEKIKEL